MNASNWIALLAIAVTLLGIAVPLMLRVLDRRQAVIDRQAAEIKLLEKANLDLRFVAISQIATTEIVNRTFSGLPGVTPEGSSTP